MASPALITAASAGAKHRMTFGHTFGAASDNYMVTGLSQFKAAAEKYSDGELEVDIHEAGSLGGQNVLPQKVLTGAIQGCQLSTGNFVNYSEVYNILDFPYLFASNDAFESTIEQDGFRDSDFLSKPASNGFQVVPGMWANAGFRVLGISKKVDRVVTTPDDLAGLKVRTNGTRVEDVMFKLTSASPVSIAWGEAYQAMQQGAADALSVGLGPLTASKIHETLSSATLYELNFNCHITTLSKRWFDKLPANVQEAIMQAGRDSYAFQKAEQKKANDQMLQLWQETGIEINHLTAGQKDQWVESIGHQRSEYDGLKDAFGRKAFDTVVGLQG
ncbi:TRAP transporter substrate-binding protein [Citreicella sp. C3M06]|uniref:TRAP transporter substrate-binding protein n=1 Tax=Citreicella sp. C3M06 TaxID=2841564 RepID=UPI001C0817FC|nr:TRAP transporter substrate-binding protein [Citreicella sp. C3M06]MBU2961106.1 TRAP transporter substrate-binding protein [Citreicella sp. C3M06]